MLTLAELAAEVAADEIDTVIIAFSDHYGRLLGKRLDAEYFLAEAANHGTHACNYLLTTDMEMEPVPGYRFANWERGYGDFHLRPDLATLRRASWLEKTAIVLCDVEDEAAHQPVAVAPRSILRRQLEAAEALWATAPWPLPSLNITSIRILTEKPMKRATPILSRWAGIWRITISCKARREESFTAAARRHLKHSGIPVESSKGEWGLGQHELNIRYADLLTMADRHSIMKHCLKEIADAQGRSVTFMAKPFAGQAGSSCHIHLSLFSKGKRTPSPAIRNWDRSRLGCISLFPRRLDGASAGADGLLRADHQFLQTLMKTAPGRRRASPGVSTIARPASALSARARVCASSAACRAPIATRTWLTRRRWRLGLDGIANKN